MSLNYWDKHTSFVLTCGLFFHIFPNKLCWRQLSNRADLTISLSFTSLSLTEKKKTTHSLHNTAMELFIKFTWIYTLTNSSEISIGVSKLFFKLLDKPWEAIIKLFSRKKKTGQSEYLLTPFTAIAARFVLLYSCPSSRPIQSHTSPGAFGGFCIVFSGVILTWVLAAFKFHLRPPQSSVPCHSDSLLDWCFAVDQRWSKYRILAYNQEIHLRGHWFDSLDPIGIVNKHVIKSCSIPS